MAATALLQQTNEGPLAVLPFENLSPDPDDAYFADGIHEEIISQLGKIAALKVISRISVMYYKGRTGNVREIAEELGVTNILEGTVRREGNRVRITVQLIEAQADQYLLNRERERIGARPTDNVEAHNAYLLGRFWWYQRTEDDVTRAIDYFQEAIDKDSMYALAFTGLADAYAVFPWYGRFSPIEAQPEAYSAATKALQLDEQLGEAQGGLKQPTRRVAIPVPTS